MNFSATWQFWPIEKKEVEEVQKCEDTMDWRKHAYLPPTPFPIHTSNKLCDGL